jgi:hypothetical protein
VRRGEVVGEAVVVGLGVKSQTLGMLIYREIVMGRKEMYIFEQRRLYR